MESDTEAKVPFSKKLRWLSNLLWGGSFLLAFEHVWHGEVVPMFPFLTAASNPADAASMLHEMSTVGVAMASPVEPMADRFAAGGFQGADPAEFGQSGVAADPSGVVAEGGQ